MNITKTAKRFLQFLLLLLVLLIGAAVAIPYFFKEEIITRVTEDINKNIDATFGFEDISLSLFHNFPNFSFSIDQFSLVGKGDFEGIPLTRAKNLRFSLDLQSVLDRASKIEVQEVQLEEPFINLLILRNGKSNFDIAAAAPSADSPSAEEGEYSFLVQLEKYGIQNGNLIYDDKQGDIYVNLEQINHQGKGNFTQDIFDLITKTQIEQMTIRTGGINYLYKTKGDFDITLNANLPENTYTLKDNTLRLNDLTLNAEGSVQTDWTEYLLDLDFSAPKNNFKNFLSLIPNAYTKDYAVVQAAGQLQLKGNVNGVYNGAKNQYPAFKILLDIDKGSFQYPDLPMGIKDIIAKATINSPSSNFDRMTIDIPKLSMNMGTNPFQAKFNLKTPVSDPDVDTEIKGKIDLSELAKAFPMEGMETLSGVLTADLTAKAKLSDIDRQNYEQVDMKGDLQIMGMNYVAQGLPPIKIKSMDLDFNPRQVKINDLEAKLGKSDLRGSGAIDNILAYFSPEKTMTGDFTLRSTFFDANEWLAEEESNASPNPNPSVEPETAVFDRFDFNVDAQVDRIVYDIYEIDQSALKGNITPSKASIDNFRLKLGPSDLSGSGQLTNIFNYLFEDETLGGKLAVNSNLFDLNPFMEEDQGAANPNAKKIAAEELEPFLVPENIAIDIDAKVKKVLYTNLVFNDLNGQLKVKEEAIRFDKVSGRTLGGKMLLSGGYDTKDSEKPGFDLDYNIQRFDFQESFKKFNTFALLAPIAKFMEGTFNSKMSFSGTLGKDLVPVIDQVNADGFLQTINSVVRGLEPLEKISEQLNIDLFRKLQIKDTKNWFTVKDGKVTLKDFNLKQEGIDMIIGGSHSFSQDMDYQIKAKIPRALLEKGAAGNVANKGLGFLKKEAGKYGVNIDVGEFVNVLINLSGNLNAPKVKFKVLGSDGEKTVVEQLKDDVKEVVEEKVEDVKEEVKVVVDNKKKDLKKKMDAEIKVIMDAANKQAANIRKIGRTKGEEARKLGYTQADNLVKKAGGNPIKKRIAQEAAKKLKKETDKKVLDINKAAEKNAKAVMGKAQKKVAEVQKKYAEK